MIWRILLLGLFGALAEGANVAGPSEFYIVTDGIYQQKGNGTASYHELLTVTADGRDSVIRYIRLEEVVHMACGQGLIVKGMEVRSPNISPAELTRNANPCAADRRELGFAYKRRGEGVSPFEPQEMGIVAQCGPKRSKLRLIDSRIVEPGMAGRFSTSLRDLWDLRSRVIDHAFPNRTPWDGGSPADDFELQEVGARVIPELANGKYDQGLRQACNPRFGGCESRSFRKLLDDYQGPRDAAELAMMTAPRLLNANLYAFAKYADPVYPALAKSARIEGQVELRLVVDPPTGEVLSVSVESGHPMLRASATEVAKQWRFAPGWANSTGVKLVLEYAIHCPRNPPLKPIPAQF